MAETQTIPWRRISVEAVVIIASILLAFSIDAWWDDRQKREETQDILMAVLEDLQSGKSFVDYYRTMSIARQDSIDKLLKASKDGASNMTDAEIDRLLADLMFFSEPHVMSEGSIEALLSAGSIGVIESKRLRRLISRWPAFLELARYNLNIDGEFVTGTWAPYLIKHGSIPQVARGLTHSPGHPEDDWQQSIDSAGEPVSHTNLLNDNQFINIVSYYWLVQTNSQVVFGQLEDRLDESIELVEKELQDSTN